MSGTSFGAHGGRPVVEEKEHVGQVMWSRFERDSSLW